MDDEIPVIREGDKNKNVKTGLCLVIVGFAIIPALVLAVPLVAALYKWAFGAWE